MSFLIEKFQDREPGFHIYLPIDRDPPLCMALKEGVLPYGTRWKLGLPATYRDNRHLYPSEGMCYECLIALGNLRT